MVKQAGPIQVAQNDRAETLVEGRDPSNDDFQASCPGLQRKFDIWQVHACHSSCLLFAAARLDTGITNWAGELNYRN